MAVSDQPTWLSRLGNWFRRNPGPHGSGLDTAEHSRMRDDDLPSNNDDGNPADVFDTHPGHGGGGNGGNSLLPNPIEPRSTFLRPWARRRDPNLQQLRSAGGARGAGGRRFWSRRRGTRPPPAGARHGPPPRRRRGSPAWGAGGFSRSSGAWAAGGLLASFRSPPPVR